MTLVMLAGASYLAGQTAQNPTVTVYGTGASDYLYFAHQTGTAVPPAQTIRIYSNPSNLPFTVTATAQTGGGWLFVNNALTTTGTTGAASQDLVVSVAPEGLAAGTYLGTIAVQAGQTTATVKVQLNVAATPQLRLDPASLPNITIEAGKTVTIPLTIGSTGAAIQYTAQVVFTDPGTGWLAVSPTLNTTGQAAQLIVNAAQIPPDRTTTYGAVRFTPLSGTGIVTLPVSVTITPGAQLQASPATVNFPYQIGFTPPTPKAVSVTSTTQTQLGYNATITSSSPWLTLSTTPSGPGTTMLTGLTTPNSFYLIPNIAAVPSTPGTLDATIRLDAPATASSQTVTVHLIISNSAQFTLSQDSATFNYTLGGTALTPVNITLGSTSAPQQFTVTPAYTSGGQFFTVSPTSGFTTTNLVITVDPNVLAALTAGTYTGNVHVASATSQTDIPVTLTVSGSTLLTLDSFQTITFDAPQGQTPTARSLIVRSTDATSQPFSVTVDYGTGASNWLILSNSTGNTGTASATLTLNVNPQAVTAAGNYNATLVITPTGVASAPALRVPVVYRVTGSATVTANPTRFDLTQQGTTPVARQSIALSSATINLSYFATVGDATWIKLVNPSGSIPGQLQFDIDATALTPRPAPYTGNITISVSGVTTLTIPVSLTVQAAATLTAAPTTLNVTYIQGAAAPTPPVINLTSSGAAIPFTAAAITANGVAWLSVSPTSGTTGAAGATATPLTITINPQGLAPGTYPGTITITPTGTGQAAITVNVALTVTQPAPPSALSIVNAATGLPRAVSPGELVTIKGRSLAPAQGVEFTVQNGAIATTLGGVRVTFDDIEAPLTYVGPSGDRTSDQINAIVPYEVSGRPTTRMVVEYRGVKSDALTLAVVESDPGLFTTNQTGTGPGAILNEDNAVNGPNNPARLGTIVQIFGTGIGLVTPATGNGRVVPITPPFPRPFQNVTATVNGQPAEVIYSGSAPGQLSGLMQVNVRIPALNVTGPTNVPIEIQIGNSKSQPNVTVSVRP